MQSVFAHAPIGRSCMYILWCNFACRLHFVLWIAGQQKWKHLKKKQGFAIWQILCRIFIQLSYPCTATVGLLHYTCCSFPNKQLQELDVVAILQDKDVKLRHLITCNRQRVERRGAWCPIVQGTHNISRGGKLISWSKECIVALQSLIPGVSGGLFTQKL